MVVAVIDWVTQSGGLAASARAFCFEIFPRLRLRKDTRTLAVK